MKLLQLIYNGDNNAKYYVEFGVQSGMECNTRILRDKYKWSGLQMDGGNQNPTITPTEKKNETKQNLFIYSITMF